MVPAKSSVLRVSAVIVLLALLTVSALAAAGANNHSNSAPDACALCQAGRAAALPSTTPQPAGISPAERTDLVALAPLIPQAPSLGTRSIPGASRLAKRIATSTGLLSAVVLVISLQERA